MAHTNGEEDVWVLSWCLYSSIGYLVIVSYFPYWFPDLVTAQTTHVFPKFNHPFERTGRIKNNFIGYVNSRHSGRIGGHNNLQHPWGQKSRENILLHRQWCIRK